jgi:hypothetical protein
MSAPARYRIPDEPRASGLSHLVVDPVWPLFAMMFAGTWLALPWFIVNSFALGSPTRAKEWLIALGGLAGTALLMVVILQETGAGSLTDTWVRVAMLSVLTVKIAVGYALYLHQSRVLEIWEHYGGNTRNGLVVVALGAMLGRPWVLASLGTPFLRAVFS